MRDVEHRSSSYRSRHKSRSKSRDRDRDRDYYSRRRRSNSRSSRSRPSKSSRKKKSKKKRYRSSSSSSTSSRSRGSIKSSSSSTRRTTTQPPSSEENSLSVQAAPPPKDLPSLSNYRDRGAIAKIEDDSFTASPFFSSAETKKLPEKVIIDLKNDTILVEDKDETETQPEESLLFHPNFIGDYMQKMDKWVNKLYNYRQKAFQE
ncbi:DNA topoisomerase 1 [Episyrphus balteatus]|uniref:DNA topoisomerase 1 n=1 Tax=Episyrphus balteatus TaxID=286459 RepID=UPI0024859D18|nr:DNA topoisomerase 1 [Episyrphus balteatus]